MPDARIMIDDLTRVAAGAFDILAGLREQGRQRARDRMGGLARRLGLVPREEFEAVEVMAQRARAQQEDLAARLAALEARLSERDAQRPAPVPDQDPAI